MLNLFYFLLYGPFILFSTFPSDVWVISLEADNAGTETESLVEVRAVFINCRINEGQASSDTEAARFQREELFKHNSLKDCNTKLALVLKFASLPERSSDEYIPIDHVVEGSNKKRIRLLNPYVLRVRWENPLQAYRLNNMDTVTGVLTEIDKRSLEIINTELKKDRVRRFGLPPTTFSTVNHDDSDDFLNAGDWHIVAPFSIESDRKTEVKRSSDGNNYLNNSLLRNKRQQHNIMVEPEITEEASWISNNDSTNGYDRSLRTADHPDQNQEDPQQNSLWKKTLNRFDKHFYHTKYSHNHRSHPEKTRMTESNDYSNDNEPLKNIKNPNIVLHQENFLNIPSSNELSKSKMNDIDPAEKTFSIYDIGTPVVWCIVHVQLFEKMSTPEGKTVWNDITRGETASISSVTPEWRDQDLNIRYRSAQWTAQEDFTLPVATNLCLLVPHTVDDSEYFIVPTEDVVLINGKQDLIKKRNENSSEYAASDASVKKPVGQFVWEFRMFFRIPSIDPIGKVGLHKSHHRRVMVRLTRALQSGTELNIVKHGSAQYLTLPHQRPHHIQIELEARADDNQLIRVGSYGRITTAVSDNSRRTRTVITVQATNTGLAAAKFKIKTRDCGPELSSLIRDKSRTGAETELVLVPPLHTRRIALDLPIEIPGDTAHCSVALVNQDDEAVAIRDVEIKKGDRCFCVWHCDCVCLSEDPKLLCREMSEPRQAAAGLTRGRARRTRSICYPNIEFINLSVVVGGVLTLLLLLGFIKALLGLIIPCIGSYGLGKIVDLPRKLERYHEYSLAGRQVVYDKDGWPVHPDTKERSVRILTRGVEFVLNLIFFIAAPFMICWNGVKINFCAPKCTKGPCVKKDSKTRFNTLDFQEKMPRWRRRRTRLRRWMTPEAEQLSTNLWHDGLFPQRSVNCKFMQPLLREDERRADESQSSSADSEQDDTEYVLTQMQKSRESLARTQMMNNNSPSTK